jgi:hypothetical protein
VRLDSAAAGKGELKSQLFERTSTIPASRVETFLGVGCDMLKIYVGLRFSLVALAGTAAPFSNALAAEPAATETIVLVRHGEKPALGLGQLDCQGFNRALALPAVIAKNFGKPDVIFAPDPAEAKEDSGKSYDYVRPLATIEPTAIALGMPVDTSIGVSKIDDLRQRLEEPANKNAFILVAWEHHYIVDLARNLMADGHGDVATVPDWKGSDFDSIYIVRITTTDTGTSATFEQGHEGLDGQPTACPGQP